MPSASSLRPVTRTGALALPRGTGQCRNRSSVAACRTKIVTRTRVSAEGWQHQAAGCLLSVGCRGYSQSTTPRQGGLNRALPAWLSWLGAGGCFVWPERPEKSLAAWRSRRRVHPPEPAAIVPLAHSPFADGGVVRAGAVLLAVLPLPVVLAAVGPAEDAQAILLVVQVLAVV